MHNQSSILILLFNIDIQILTTDKYEQRFHKSLTDSASDSSWHIYGMNCKDK